MRTVYFLKHWTNEFAFLTEKEAIEYGELHPLTIHSRDDEGNEVTRTEYYEVVEGTLPAIVKCRTCRANGVETIVTADDPKKFPYCKHCFYTGAAMTHMMAATISKINLAIPTHEASVWHTGGGCFALTVCPRDHGDGMLDTPYYMLTGDDFECMTIPANGVSCIGKYMDESEDNKTHEYAGQRAAMIYEGYESFGEEGEPNKITVAQAIKRIKADIRKPAPFTETF